MNKLTFLSEIAKPLKEMGFRKNKAYWYKAYNELLFCINVQGSQWCKNDYYVEIGVAFCSNEKSSPSLLQWYCRHRCIGANGEKNVLPGELLTSVSEIFDKIHSIEDLNNLLVEKQAAKVVSQYWF